MHPNTTTEPLAFVEWFSRSSTNPDPNSKMFRIKKEYSQIQPIHVIGEVIKLTKIAQSIQLIPVFPKTGIDPSWHWINVKSFMLITGVVLEHISVYTRYILYYVITNYINYIAPSCV
jgi:hypothetical protein